MRVIVIYREASEQARAVTDFLREYARRTGRSLETLSPDTSEGSHLCRMYDVVEYPTVLATSDSGALLQMWRGLPMPLINEVSYYDEAI